MSKDLVRAPSPTQEHERPTSVQLGIWGPTLREQGFDTILDPADVDHFMLDDKAISRLHIRGLITTAQHAAARERLCKKIKRAVKLHGGHQ